MSGHPKTNKKPKPDHGHGHTHYHHHDTPPVNTPPQQPAWEHQRLECVMTSVGFDDVLDETLRRNHQHFDTVIVVTTANDWRTQAVANRHSALVVISDLFTKNGRQFNKGAAINQGLHHFQYRGWRAHLDVDIVLPDNFRRVLFNHTHLDPECLYGCDRIDVPGKKGLRQMLDEQPAQHHLNMLMRPADPGKELGSRYVSSLYGYVPLGFFQLWHASKHRSYPYSLGTAAHDDVLFAAQWPRAKRVLLPTMVCYHLCTGAPKWGQNWEGRRSPRLEPE